MLLRQSFRKAVLSMVIRHRCLLQVATVLILGAVSGTIFRHLVQLTSGTAARIMFTNRSSSYKCEGDTRASLLCTYHQVVYWNKTIYFVQSGEHQKKPPIPDISVPRAQENPTPVKVVTLAHLEDEVFSLAGPSMATVQEGVIWQRAWPEDLYHTLWENVANVHAVVCKQLKKCTYIPNDPLQLIFVDEKEYPDRTKPWVQLWQCVSGQVIEEAANTRYLGAVFINSLAIGIGPEMQGKPVTTGGRYPLSKEMLRSWLARMKACMHMPLQTNVSQLVPPVVTLLTREMGEHAWSVLNHREVVHFIKDRLPGSVVQAVDMANMSIQDQARLIGNTSVFISAHGPQVGLLLWLPANGVFIEAEQYGLTSNMHYKTHVSDQMNEVNHIHHLRFGSGNASSLVCRDSVAKDSSFLMLTPNEQAHWRKHPVCGYSWIVAKGLRCDLWVRNHCDIKLQLDKLGPAVDAAKEWLYMHGILHPELANNF